MTASLFSTVTRFGHQQSLGCCKSSQLLRFAKLFLFKCHPNYRSGSHVFLKDPPHSWNLAAPIPICCTSPTNTEVVLACFILRSEVSVRETKLPPLGLLFILFSIFNCIQKMLLEFGSCWGSSSDISGFTQAQGRVVQTVAIRLMKGFRFAWI